MKPIHLFSSLFVLMLFPKAEEIDLLSPEKRHMIEEQQKINESEHEKLRYNWLSPLNLSGSFSRDKSAGSDYHTDMQQVSASVSQDIFRSGGITYQIAYADAKLQNGSIALKQDIAGLNQQLFTALLNYRKNRLELEQSSKKIDNYDIEIFIKRQQYDAGKADITQLNNALMDKSSELKTYASLQYSIAEQRYEIAKISDIDPDAYPLAAFSLIEAQEYFQNRLDLRYARSLGQTYQNLYHVTDSGYLPSIALNADAGYKNLTGSGSIVGYDGSFYSAGLSLTVPFTYNASAAIQEARSTYLKQAAATADLERETKASYAQSLELVKSYREYIDITSRNLALYDELISVTKAGVDAGYKTGYDLKTLQNSKTIEEYTVKINELNIQIELAKLHFAVNTAKELQ